MTNCHVTIVVQVFDGHYPISSFQTVRNTLPGTSLKLQISHFLTHQLFVMPQNCHLFHLQLRKRFWCQTPSRKGISDNFGTQTLIFTHMLRCSCSILKHLDKLPPGREKIMLAASLGCEHVLLVQLRVVRLKADITRIRHMLVIKYNHHI